MKKSQREEIRARADARKQHNRKEEQELKAKREEKTASALHALKTKEREREEKAFSKLPPSARTLIQHLLEGPPAGRRLVSSATLFALTRLGEVPALRPFGTWVPRGKGRDSVFRSLCEHLIAKYPTPAFLWSAFEDTDNVFVPLVVHVAQGGSLFQFLKEGKLPFTLTRAQCAEFMQTESAYGIIDAVRRVQVKAEGGDRKLFENWRRLQRVRLLQTPLLEAFGLTVLRFLARNPMLNPDQYGPLCDYVYHRRAHDANFSMQGRSVNALVRDIIGWHLELNSAKEEKARAPVIFERSGFRTYKVEQVNKETAIGKRGYSKEESKFWSVTEILSSTALRDEGKTLHHCVYSYRPHVEAKRISIWSLGLEDSGCNLEKLVTLEVTNAGREVVQARGKYNRMPTAQENKVILDWASKNGLTIRYGGRW